MIDLEGLPLPDDAPAPGSCVRVERPEQGLALMIIDPPHQKLAVLDLAVLRDLDLALDELDGDRQLRGLVVTGRDPLSFLVGADLDSIEAAEDPAPVARMIAVGQHLFGRFGRLASGSGRVRSVAAVGGVVPGGAFELALACDRIVISDHPSSRIGLPETQLGIVPAWGGCQRLPRRVGIPAALDAILKGSLLPAKVAYRKGFVDRLTPPEYMLRVAGDVALGRKSCKRRGRGKLASVLVDRNPLAAKLFADLSARQILRKTRGKYPAPLDAARLVSWAPLKRIEKGFLGEQEAGSRLATGKVCKSLIGVFRMMEGAKKLGRRPDRERVQRFGNAGVLGAGVMGAGIASLLAEKGVDTRLFDIAPASLDAAQIEHRAELAKKRKRRRIAQHEFDAAVDRLSVSEEWIGFGRAELVVEAVAERLEIKRDVLGRIAEQVSSEAVICTNTSSLSVDAIAAGLPAPERFCGLHFFNPVRKMPLVEIVRGQATTDEVVTRLAALCTRLGKTPVVVKDVPGFLVNRLLGPYLDEALCLYSEGVSAARIDALALEFGMPMGPLRLLDEVGLDIASHAAASLHAAYGERMRPAVDLAPMLDAERLGKKTGKGFYLHRGVKRGKEAKLADDLARVLPQRSASASGMPDGEITDRLMFAMLAEALRALSEGVVDSAAELDLATVFGMGFPPFRGGLMRWARELGRDEVAERLKSIAQTRGERFEVQGELLTITFGQSMKSV